MRISTHDKLFNTYSQTTVISSEGYETKTYVISLSNVPGDFQPMGAKFDPALYGIDSNPAEVKKLFIDLDYNVPIGCVLKYIDTGKVYIVKALDVWYGHQKLIIAPYDVVVP